MGDRLSSEQLNMIKEKLEVDKLWSFSKVGTFDTCTWLYKLKYIDKIRINEDNCYTWWGTVAHDLIQGLYDGEHTYEEMASKLEDKIIEYNMLDDPKLAFPEQSQFESYIENLQHYFSNVRKIPYNVINEKPVIAIFEGNEKYAFQGYIDSEFIDEDGNIVIMDYKTSSISGFSGKKLLEKARQLMIYAMGINQHGRMVDNKMREFPMDKIKIRYDMMKYLNVSYIQANGKEKVTKAERRLWVGKISNQLRKDLEGVQKEIAKVEKEIKKLERKYNAKVRTEDEKVIISKEIEGLKTKIDELDSVNYDVIAINTMIEDAINNNSLDNMPKFVQEKYTVSDCHIDVEMTEEVLESFKKSLISTLDNIVDKTESGDAETAFNRDKIAEADSFYCNNLCDLKEYCSFYKEYKEHNAMFIDDKQAPSDDELLAMLGL
ncbi:PD-(D/E)XK nuclease family protein [Virgibacillus sp. M23]|uniref:PD-(D/E)XK nuclease family protein n=1 Tax=Virgibacillus sp. M23 TaxID=3079030 RepID=UPI002A90FAE9|nr:PD-(D/E)XK nuclease family protein [Virgibacillus sp. M23]MDY7043602.1 PD-(D/E)XK nuclease family protein [Virgibacillus sp. M23]